MIVAAIAEKFGKLFENLANAILMRCSEFLSSILKFPDDYCGFAEKYAGTELAVVAFKLQAGMKHVKPSSVKRCCMLKTCRRGKPMLELDDFTVGERVKINPDAKDDQVTDEQRKNSAEGIIKDIDDDDDDLAMIYLHGDCDGWYYVKVDNVATFLFSKC